LQLRRRSGLSQEDAAPGESAGKQSDCPEAETLWDSLTTDKGTEDE
jgi:hypothetical protein